MSVFHLYRITNRIDYRSNLDNHYYFKVSTEWSYDIQKKLLGTFFYKEQYVTSNALLYYVVTSSAMQVRFTVLISTVNYFAGLLIKNCEYLNK